MLEMEMALDAEAVRLQGQTMREIVFPLRLESQNFVFGGSERHVFVNYHAHSTPQGRSL
jgi:hypothetical protein